MHIVNKGPTHVVDVGRERAAAILHLLQGHGSGGYAAGGIETWQEVVHAFLLHERFVIDAFAPTHVLELRRLDTCDDQVEAGRIYAYLTRAADDVPKDGLELHGSLKFEIDENAGFEVTTEVGRGGLITDDVRRSEHAQLGWCTQERGVECVIDDGSG